MTKKSDINLRWTGARLLAAVALGVMLVAIAAPRPAMAQGPCQPDTVRFLEEAAFGPSPELCAYVESLDPVLGTAFGKWLDAQFNLPLPNYPDLFSRPEDGGNGCPGAPVGQPGYCPDNSPCGSDAHCNRWNYTMWPLQNWFYQRALNVLPSPDPSGDQLRQRVAFALNQIVVISGQHDNLHLSQRILPYVQLLDKDAFGNFRDLLKDITLNPGMGRYLDMVGNNKNNPNENFAREILQLFSIGLSKVNEDGTPILDDQGSIQPTYTQDTITNFARVFTGWNFAGQPRSGITNYFDPMVVGNENNHDRNAKTLLDHGDPSCSPPGGENALPELNEALDCIFSSPYVAPYISKNLIEHLVTSNPSPTYVSDIVQVFKDNGQGVRGDLQAVVRAILTHPEARSYGPSDPNFGHLREPVLWIASLLRAFDSGQGTSPTTDFVLGEQFLPSDIRMDEDVFRSPTVFNFFPPDFQIAGETGILGPEFNIVSTSTALSRINFACEVAFHGDPPFPTGCKMSTNADRPTGTWIDPAYLANLPTDPGALVDYLNNLMLHGQMTDSMRSTVINDLNDPMYSDPVARAREAVYLVATSSQYLVER